MKSKIVILIVLSLSLFSCGESSNKTKILCISYDSDDKLYYISSKFETSIIEHRIMEGIPTFKQAKEELEIIKNK